MEMINEWIIDNVGIVVLILVLINLLMFIMLLVSKSKVKKLKNQYDYFMHGSENDKTIDELLNKTLEKIDLFEEKTKNTDEQIKMINDKLKLCIQKFGIVRYNPFDHMGGDLSFAIAFLDENNTGVILNGIHSREGSYVYAKPIKNGRSTYKLSDEEVQALQRALSN